MNLPNIVTEGHRRGPRERNDSASPNASVSSDNMSPRLWSLHTFLSLVLAFGLIVAMAFMVDLDAVWRELMKSNKTLVLLGLVTHYATFPVRGMRWRRALSHLHTGTGSGKFGMLIFFYLFIDNLVPAKLGELYGAHLARINLGISRSAALGSLAFLRMADAWLILLLASISSWALFSHHLPNMVFGTLVFGLGLVVLLTFIMVIFLIFRSVPTWVPEIARKMIDSFRSGMRPRRRELVAIGVLTSVVWALEIIWMLFLSLSFGLSLTAMDLVFVTMIPVLASASPFTPGGAGVVELTLYGCLIAVGFASPTAASVTFMNRFIDYWLHNVFGVLTWLARHRFGLRTWWEASVEASPEVAS